MLTVWYTGVHATRLVETNLVGGKLLKTPFKERPSVTRHSNKRLVCDRSVRVVEESEWVETG